MYQALLNGRAAASNLPWRPKCLSGSNFGFSRVWSGLLPARPLRQVVVVQAADRRVRAAAGKVLTLPKCPAAAASGYLY